MKKLVAIVALMALAGCTSPVGPVDHTHGSGSLTDSGDVVLSHTHGSGS